MEQPPFDPTQSLLRTLCRLGRSSEEVLDHQCVEAATKHVLSPSKVRLLRLLDRIGAHPLGEVARLLGVSESAASQLVESLVRQRLIERRPDDDDRRCIQVALRPAGTRAIRAIDRKRRERMEVAVAQVGLSPRQWSQFCNIASQLTLALDGNGTFDTSRCFACDAWHGGSRESTGCTMTCPADSPPADNPTSQRKRRTSKTQPKRRKQQHGEV